MRKMGQYLGGLKFLGAAGLSDPADSTDTNPVVQKQVDLKAIAAPPPLGEPAATLSPRGVSDRPQLPRLKRNQ